MEHPCYRCHADIPENTAFCPHCGAPQIRVVAPESSVDEATDAASLTPPATPASPTSVAPPWMRGGAAYPPLPGVVLWPLAWKDALLCGVGAAVLFVLSAPVIRMGGVIWMLLGGALAARLYRRHLPGTTVTPGMGMRLGALAGVFGFLANAVTSLLSFLALHNSGAFRHAMEEQMQMQLAGNTDPQVHQIMHNLLDYMSTPQGAATMITVFLLMFGLMFVLLSAAGGALGASFFGRRHDVR